jgi:hypothetical protein
MNGREILSLTPPDKNITPEVARKNKLDMRRQLVF